jgi:hypothetical protein
MITPITIICMRYGMKKEQTLHMPMLIEKFRMQTMIEVTCSEMTKACMMNETKNKKKSHKHSIMNSTLTT